MHFAKIEYVLSLMRLDQRVGDLPLLRLPSAFPCIMKDSRPSHDQSIEAFPPWLQSRVVFVLSVRQSRIIDSFVWLAIHDTRSPQIHTSNVSIRLRFAIFMVQVSVPYMNVENSCVNDIYFYFLLIAPSFRIRVSLVFTPFFNCTLPWILLLHPPPLSMTHLR